MIAKNVTFQLDTLPVNASGITVPPGINYQFDPETNRILIGGNGSDSIEVCYRKMAREVFDTLYSRKPDTYAPAAHSQSMPLIEMIDEQGVFELSNIESFGSITRGVTFGNRQNLFVNSALNLQMDGKLSEDLSISAVITDQNIPYQPEGNTQQLRDFDNVYIRLYNDRFNLIAGDIVLQNPVQEGQFLKYYKNVQGIKMDYKYNLGSDWSLTSVLSGSAAKGKFSSSVISPIENVQGPYKLQGPNGERFIIVLANSEKVYIDGKLMERGFDRDYVIDYNLAEVTFNSNVVITRFTRIRIDFEYAEQFYGRSNVTASQTLEKENVKVYFNYYRESDNPDNTIGFDLEEEDYESLGRSANRQGVIHGYDSVGFMENQISYLKKDTTDLDGERHEIYVFSVDKEKAHWTVSFSETGEGQGDYILSGRNANGKIFQWVSPRGGISQGNYAPVITIPTPNRKEMIVAGSKIDINGHEFFFQELALSVNDQNLYSNDNRNNMGYAWKGGIESNRPVEFLPEYTFKGRISFEYDHENFQSIDRFRTIEFDRNWAYDIFSDSVNRSDEIFDLELGLSKDLQNQLNYQLTKRDRTDVINGTQQSLRFSKKLGVLQISSDNFLMHNRSGGLRSDWSRSMSDFKLNIWKLSPGYSFALDRHSASVGDSTFNTLMHYHSHNYYLQSNESKKGFIRLDYIRRFDQIPDGGELVSYTAAEEVKLSLNSKHFENHTLSGQLNYRSVTDHTVENQDKNIMGRFDWLSGYFQNNIRQHITFSTANTLELKRDFIFVPVPVGEGTHTWRDENGDGIQDLNEFYEAINPDEKSYIKLFTPTDEYIQAFQTAYLHTLDASFPSRWRELPNALSEISKVSISGSLRVNFKTTATDPGERINPFSLNLVRDQYLFARNQGRYSLFYNRNAPGLGFDITRQNQDNKSLLSNGYELRRRRSWDSNFRWTVDSYILRFKGSMGDILNQADYVEGRNFMLATRSYSPEIVWQADKKYRITGNWERRLRRDMADESEQFSDINEFGVMLTWIRQGQGSLSADFSWVEISFEGEENTFLGYELLEALQPGANQKWNINWQQSLGSGLQLSLQYFGRKSTDNRAVHTGTAQLTAYF